VILLLVLVAVVTFTIAIAVWALVLDWWNDAREVLDQTRRAAVEQLEWERLAEETQILADIEWDTEYFPVEEPVYTREHLEGGA
jgi:hypothetical protein